jgi:hypothetical protein
MGLAKDQKKRKCMCKKRIKIIRGFERENTHIKKE